MKDKMKSIALAFSNDEYLRLLEEAGKQNLTLNEYIKRRLRPEEQYEPSAGAVETKEIEAKDAGAIFELLDDLDQLQQCMATAMKVVHSVNETEKRVKGRRHKVSSLLGKE